jgi:hypothetical protein
MNDQREPFELDLKARLDVDPSPGLQSRIRARAFAKPERRIPWFTLSAGLATAAVTVTFAVLYIQREQIAPPTPVTPPVPIVEKIEPPAPREKSEPARAPKESPRFTIVFAASDEIELRPLDSIEITDSLRPIPEASIPSVARLEPITLEPAALPIRNIGVTQ